MFAHQSPPAAVLLSSDASPLARHLAPRLDEALADTPVVLVHGPRQSGKTTLAREMGAAHGMDYVTFDDDVRRASAQADPVGAVRALPERVVLDEVQRVPELFTSLKATVDADRRPGRFLLTGSANVLLVPALADSLAGRMEVLRLHPLSQAELAAHRPALVGALFSNPADLAGAFADLLGGASSGASGGTGGRAGSGGTADATGGGPGESGGAGPSLVERVVGGGYAPALARATAVRRAAWYRAYVEAIVQRDVREMARIRSLDVLPSLMAHAAGQTARLFNASELSQSFQQSQPTIREYLSLLERVFLVERLPPWHSNRLSRLVKTPKLHVTDSGLAAALLGVSASALAADRGLLGQLLETFVVQEIRRLVSAEEVPVALYHYRDRDGAEVDVVLERDGRVAGVEVKASATVRRGDFRGLEQMRSATGSRFAGGVVLYDGDVVVPFGDGLVAAPLSVLWGGR